jgi:hypothetical protein
VTLSTTVWRRNLLNNNIKGRHRGFQHQNSASHTCVWNKSSFWTSYARKVLQVANKLSGVLCVFFWVSPRRQILVSRRFETLCQFYLQGLHIQPLKMERTLGTAPSANQNLTRGRYPKEHTQYSRHGESLKSSKLSGEHTPRHCCWKSSWFLGSKFEKPSSLLCYFIWY